MPKRQIDMVDPTPDRNGLRHDYAQCWKGWGSPDKVWIGFFIDYETAVAWVKVQADADAYTVNNVPPVRAMGGNGNKPAKQVRKQTGLRPAPTAEPMGAHALPVTVQAEPVSEDVKALRQDAGALLDQHRADEADELAAAKAADQR